MKDNIKEGYKDSALGEIPDSWEAVQLGDVVLLNMGQSPSSSSYNDDEKGLPLIQGNADIKNRVSMPRIWTKEVTKECNVGDVIMTVRAPVGAIALSKHNACIGRGVCAISSENINQDYLYQYLVSYESKWDKLSQGSTFTAVNGADIKGVLIPNPPLKEQKKIAEILSTVDKKIDIVEQQIKETKELKRGLMQKLLVKGIGHTKFKDSPLGQIPHSWEVESIDNIGIELIDGDRGSNYPKAQDFSEQGYCLFLSAKNVTKYGFKFNECQFISEERDLLLRKGKLEPFDIVITTRGSVGHIALFDSNVPYSNVRLNSGMVIIRDIKSIYDKSYLYQLMNSSIVKKQLEFITSGSAQPQLTIEGLKKIKFLTFSFEEQKQIAEILTTVDDKIDILEKKKSEIKDLKKGLMQQLLTGKTRVNLN